VLRDLGDVRGARTAFERALGIWQAAYADEHPKVATAHNNLGLVLQDLGDLAGARAAFERALEIFEKFLPEGHPNIAVARENLERLGTGGPGD
jgi:tetratricopeptide (TPR) repeat protein